MAYRFGYILQRSCWPSLVRICWTIKSIATWLSPPRGIIMSAYFFVGSIKSSKAGFTNFEYCMQMQPDISKWTIGSKLTEGINCGWASISQQKRENRVKRHSWNQLWWKIVTDNFMEIRDHYLLPGQVPYRYLYPSLLYHALFSLPGVHQHLHPEIWYYETRGTTSR